MIKVGLIGYGYWGPNILRNFLINSNFQVVAVAEMNQTLHQAIIKVNPQIKVTTNATDILADPEINAVAIATPVGTHFTLALAALKNGKHVLVEKPLCTTSEECQELIAHAKKANLTLMVDHTFIFTGAVQKIRQICDSGELGKVCSFDSTRVNLGLFQQDVNVLWDLAPHDFSIINYLFDDEPIDIEANGYSHLNSHVLNSNPHLPDVVYLTVHFASNIIAHFNMSWMSPVKVRRVAIGGTNKMLVWDDLNPSEKIKVYNCGISYQQQESRNKLMPQYRIGDIFSPKVSHQEALQGVIEHFAQVIYKQETPLMDGVQGLRVVRMLEEAQASLDKTMKRIIQKREKRECLLNVS